MPLYQIKIKYTNAVKLITLADYNGIQLNYSYKASKINVFIECCYSFFKCLRILFMKIYEKCNN